jgi:hypothetical protein
MFYVKVINIFLSAQKEIKLKLTSAGSYTHIAINKVIYHTTTEIKFCEGLCMLIYGKHHFWIWKWGIFWVSKQDR